MKKPMGRIICTITLVACFALPALADDIAYSDLGPGGSFQGYLPAVAIIGASTGYGYQAIADPFSASVGGPLTQVDIGLGGDAPTYASTAVISIYTDVNNNLGTLVFSGEVLSAPTPPTATLTTLSAISGQLVAGDPYFLVVAPGADNTYDGWFNNSTGVLGTILADQGSGFSGPFNTGDPIQAFDVRVQSAAPVPEPSTWAMLGAELFCLLALVGRKRFVDVR
jgi:hypothetical protein